MIQRLSPQLWLDQYYALGKLEPHLFLLRSVAGAAIGKSLHDPSRPQSLVRSDLRRILDLEVFLVISLITSFSPLVSYCPVFHHYSPHR